MILGILVNTDKHRDDVLGIAQAAVSKGNEVIIFTMDEGIRLFEDRSYAGLCKQDGIRISFCDHNAQKLGLNKEGISEQIVCGSQYDNAVMVHEADRIIVL